MEAQAPGDFSTAPREAKGTARKSVRSGINFIY